MDMSFMAALNVQSGGSGGSGGKNGVGIASMEINDKGELVIVLSDGRVRNLGRIVGADGAVYVPHINDQKILSFTIEQSPGKIPDPVDLNSAGIDSSDVTTDEEVGEMIVDVFGKQNGDGAVSDDRVATDEEVAEMLREVFGRLSSGGTVNEDEVVTDEEVAEMLREVFSL